MNRSKGTYLQGIMDAEQVAKSYDQNSQSFVEEVLWALNDVLDDLEPYYDGAVYCNGFSDYIDHFTKNKELIVNNFKRKGVVNEI